MQNPCTRLEVTTSHGRFVAQDVPYHGLSQNWGEGEEEVVDRITFDVFDSRFDSQATGEPTYWVIPLTNFVSEFRVRVAQLDRHPLRIYPTPQLPPEIFQALSSSDDERDDESDAETGSGVSTGDALSVWLTATSKNQLIAFEFDDGLGFIERLADYDERKDKLLAGTSHSLPTAVMVGAVGEAASMRPSADTDELERWLKPQDLLMLLTLATGTEVSAPWIELRDARGKLVRRFHRRLRQTRFSRGHRVIDELPFKDERRRMSAEMRNVRPERAT